jgi:hypothetical protein
VTGGGSGRIRYRPSRANYRLLIEPKAFTTPLPSRRSISDLTCASTCVIARRRGISIDAAKRFELDPHRFQLMPKTL